MHPVAAEVEVDAGAEFFDIAAPADQVRPLQHDEVEAQSGERPSGAQPRGPGADDRYIDLG